MLRWLHSWLSDRTIAVRFHGCLSTPVSIRYRSKISFLLFHFYIDDISFGGQDMLFMDECCIFSRAPTVDHFYAFLQTRLYLIEVWARSNRIMVGVHKCWVLPYKLGARSSVKQEIRYLGVNSLPLDKSASHEISKLHLADIASTSQLRAQSLRHLRSPRLKIFQGILRFIFQGWVIGTSDSPFPFLVTLPTRSLTADSDHPFAVLRVSSVLQRRGCQLL